MKRSAFSVFKDKPSKSPSGADTLDDDLPKLLAMSQKPHSDLSVSSLLSLFKKSEKKRTINTTKYHVCLIFFYKIKPWILTHHK